MKQAIQNPNSVFLRDFYNESIFQPPSTWRCINYPYFQQIFEDWLALHVPGCKFVIHYKKCRSHNRWGNRGGWIEKPTSVELLFENEGSSILFQLEWVL